MSEAEEWAGRRGSLWAARMEALDRQLAPAGAIAMRALAPAPGERVLDLGCGAGAMSAEIARAVGREGAVTGVDVSADLLAAARARPGTDQVRFIEGDATTADLGAGAHDALFSRFGCMFFEEPERAYANLARALRPGARVVLAVWTDLARNPWAAVPADALAEVMGPLDPPPPGTPGPFAWADPAAYRDVLRGAGLTIGEETEHEIELVIGDGDDPDPLVRGVEIVTVVGPAARRLKDRPADEVAAVRAHLATRLKPYVRDGWLRMPGEIRIIRARK